MHRTSWLAAYAVHEFVCDATLQLRSRIYLKGITVQRIFVPSSGESDWRKLLGDPETHWVRGRSAFETATSWERSANAERGLPTEIAAALDTVAELASAELLIAIPEHKVALTGRGKPSQNDVWALLKGKRGLISMAVEAKAGEPFDVTVGEWNRARGTGRENRLRQLCSLLDIIGDPPAELRYQLLHRSASAILEAQRFGASAAVMLVQSFGNCDDAWIDFSRFADALGAEATRGRVAVTRCANAVSLYLGWVDCKVASDRPQLTATP